MAGFQALTEEVAALRRQRFEDTGTAGTIPVFSGEIEDLSHFIDKFDVSSVAYGWNNAEKCQRFPLYLRAYASDIYKSIPEYTRVNFNNMIAEFRRSLTTTDAPKLFGCQLRARKQREGEPANIFASHLTHLAKQAYPRFDIGELEPILRDCFLFGLLPYLQNRMLDKDITNFDDAIRNATNLEMRIKYIQPAMGLDSSGQTLNTQSTPQANTTNMSKLETDLADIKSMLQNYPRSSSWPNLQLTSQAKPTTATTMEMSEIQYELANIRSI